MDPTITSIAKKAGVSHSTGSRALADSPLTNAATKERIRRLAEEAGYRPHRVARSLVTGKTQTLGFVITNLKNPFFAELTDRLHRATRERGYQLLVALDDGDQAQRVQQLDYLTDRRVDGILAWTGLPRHDHPCFRSPRGQRTPFVVLGTRVEDDATSFVATDRPAGMEQAVEHLTRLGLTRIGYVGCDMESPAPPRLFSKYAGFLAAMERRGLRSVACIDHRTTGRNSAALYHEAGYEAGRKLAADPHRPRAVVCD